MQRTELLDLFERVLLTRGPDEVRTALMNLDTGPGSDLDSLTIIANAGIHEIPKAFLRGEVYEASRGDWDASTEEALIGELITILSRLANKLRSQQWQRVYLIPTGHPILSIQIKAMVFRLLRLNTIDLYYKAGKYFEVDLDQRGIALKAGSRG